jgi:hypothetical protein
MKKLDRALNPGLLKSIEELISVPFTSKCLLTLRGETKSLKSPKKRAIKKVISSKVPKV